MTNAGCTSSTTPRITSTAPVTRVSQSPKEATRSSQITTESASIHANCMVPKAIMLNLVNFAKESMQRELLQSLYQQDILKELMKESDHVVARRRECVKMIGALEKAAEICATV